MKPGYPQRRPNLVSHVLTGEVIGIIGSFVLNVVAGMPFYGILGGAGVGCFLGFMVWMIRQDRWRMNPVNRLPRTAKEAHFRKIAQKRAEANRIAQLNKPDFDSRLNQFVSENVDSALPPGSELEPFVSKAPYWQREPYGEPTPPKPRSFIRRILLRISKIVHDTGTFRQ